MSIEFACPACKKKFAVKDELSGKVAQCSGCSKKLRIPQPKPQPTGAQVSVASRSKLDDLLDDYEPESSEEPEFDIPPEIAVQLQAEIEAEKKKKGVTDDPICPDCGAKFIGSTVVCVTCGYDAKGGPGGSQHSIGSLLFSSDGRISRSVYWTASIIVTMFNVAVTMTVVVVAFTMFDLAEQGLPIYLFMGLNVFSLFIVWIQLSLLIKRWHDRDKSGLWVFIGLVPFIGAVWTFVEAGCMPGTVGNNSYGPDPLDRKIKIRKPSSKAGK